MDISDWRKKIDELDRRLVELLSERAQAAHEIGRLKRDAGMPIYEPDREQTVFQNVQKMNPGPLPDRDLMRIYERIMDIMRQIQQEEIAPAPVEKEPEPGTTELDSSFQLHKENNLVGRTDPNSSIFPEVDLSRFDPETKVSRRHARIWREGETFLIEDLNSVNGTVINDAVRLAPRQPRVLESGDKLRLGETTLHFLVG